MAVREINHQLHTLDLLPPSHLSVSTSSKRTSSTAVQSSERDLTDPVAGGESVEEVLVEVAEEGAMTEEGASFVDEFRQEQQEEKAKSKIFKGTIVLIMAGRGLGGRGLGAGLTFTHYLSIPVPPTPLATILVF